MVLIPSGPFLMGSDPDVDDLAFDDEQPQHSLYLPAYYLAWTPITNAQYAAFVEATGCSPPSHWKEGKPPSGEEYHPVVYVSFDAAMAYCRWLSGVTGKPCTLPSEAEWEKGARGTDGWVYPWGDEWDSQRCNSKEGGSGDATPVEACPGGASPYGLLDMAGNVWEWTRSAYRDYPYDPHDGREDLSAGNDVARVLRGGAFYGYRRSVRCASRYWGYPYLWDWYYGFRVASVPPAGCSEI